MLLISLEIEILNRTRPTPPQISNAKSKLFLKTKTMSQFTRTWWGNKFISALEKFTDEGRLSRGRTYARGSKVVNFEISGGRAIATVRGSVNPYFGVYKEPLYGTEIQIKPISQKDWTKVIAYIASKAGFISKLILNEMPDQIEDAFSLVNLNLLPTKKADFTNKCSCPDGSNPCKHIAGVYYLLAAELDRDPLLLFELRGLSKADLQTELLKSPLGSALAAELMPQQLEPEIARSYYPELVEISPDKSMSLQDFWQGKRLPPLPESNPVSVPAITIKKQGDYPAFWTLDRSFIATMEEFYDRVKTKNKDIL
jgi:uncharacterized Zn finger protein